MVGHWDLCRVVAACGVPVLACMAGVIIFGRT
jgi:hypothetical protein